MKIYKAIASSMLALLMFANAGEANAATVVIERPDQMVQPTVDWGQVSRVFGSYVECERKRLEYAVKFEAFGACIPTKAGTWLLTVRWRS